MRSFARATFEVLAIVGILAGVAYLVAQVYLPVRVAGSSMHPALHAGDVVMVHRGASPAQADVVLVRQAGHSQVLHRVISVLPDRRVRTQGDANPVADRELINGRDIRGTVVAVLPVGRAIEQWRAKTGVGYDVGSTEQHTAMTEKTSSKTPADQGRAP